MRKLLLLFLCTIMVLIEPAEALAEVAMASVATTEALAEAAVATPVPSPNYKRYKGNSRRKRGPIAAMKRWAKRRKTRRKIRAAHKANPSKAGSRKGVITVDKPVRSK
ncbi:hypothetical protein D3Y59_12905 [Hymenobacter oligotrophus]|uniref:Uncharacterized protein n=1 Tax=Hymenobacter oligotrophus TaxID=2319843 RepID=A0A3B7R372_9BACT|nr:hypothetical protein [Hymenobacter oligotrophus]AYA37863.1 hypothetical protein D3Y59_12905 [Hymenobacter oligotrophus]